MTTPTCSDSVWKVLVWGLSNQTLHQCDRILVINNVRGKVFLAQCLTFLSIELRSIDLGLCWGKTPRQGEHALENSHLLQKGKEETKYAFLDLSRAWWKDVVGYWESCWRLTTRVFRGDGFHFVSSRVGCISLESPGDWLTLTVNLTEVKVTLETNSWVYIGDVSREV